ncbi:hypothetical protein K502DRAFT_365595 [Neoconidiobolus thromboides FSU 785]|nr:hypothetical protein K502DRAFT_365595 [Neoconidiobolus thromboides FSU 785]
MDARDYLKYIRYNVFPEISKVSLSLAIVVVLTMIAFTIYDRKLVNRVTLRLQTVIACYDIWSHSFPLWARENSKEGNPLCTTIAYQTFAFPLFYAFLNVAIGINLQLVFIHGIFITKKIEVAYYIGSILLTLLITIPPLALGLLGYSEFNGCYLASDDEYFSKMFDFFANVLVNLICMAYLLVIVILILIKLYQGHKVTKENQVGIDVNKSSETLKNIRLLASRTLLYPIVMIVANIGVVISQTAYDLLNIDSPELSVLAYITGGLLGTLNFVAFFCDPTIHQALTSVYFRTIKKQSEADRISIII